MEDSSGLSLRGLATVLLQDELLNRSQRKDGNANLVDFIIHKERRVVRSTFSADLNGLVDSMESLLLIQVILYQVHCGTTESPHQLVDKFETGRRHTPLDLGVDAKVVYNAIKAVDVCDPAEPS